MEANDPVISVILIAGNQRERATRCLNSILGQNIIDKMEVILMDCASNAIGPLPGSDHPKVRVVRLSDNLPYGKVRADSVLMASSPIVAFIEEHCIAFPSWAAALVRAHEGPWAGICGEVHNGNPRKGISDTVALLNYAPWLAPAKRNTSQLLPGHNSAYKRELLLRYGDQLGKLLMSEVVFQWKLEEDGYELFLEPDAKFAHTNETKLQSICKGYYLWNRCFGHVRAEMFKWSLSKKAFYVLLTPLIPCIRMVKLFKFIARHRTDLLGYFFSSLLLMPVMYYAGAIGQTMGLVFGIGNADVEFLAYEVNEYRGEKNDGL